MQLTKQKTKLAAHAMHMTCTPLPEGSDLMVSSTLHVGDGVFLPESISLFRSQDNEIQSLRFIC